MSKGSRILLRIRTKAGLEVRTFSTPDGAVSEATQLLEINIWEEPAFVQVTVVNPFYGRTFYRAYVSQITGDATPMCQVCGCTELDPCDDGDGMCSRVEPGLCSACKGSGTPSGKEAPND